MIVGKYLKNTALYSPDELERLDKHIEKYFGKSTIEILMAVAVTWGLGEE